MTFVSLPFFALREFPFSQHWSLTCCSVQFYDIQFGVPVTILLPKVLPSDRVDVILGQKIIHHASLLNLQALLELHEVPLSWSIPGVLQG